jgi:SAM-dependent methyltransferase
VTEDKRGGRTARPRPKLEVTLETLGRAGDFGALAHYADPAYYTQCYRSRKHDVEYYVRLARAHAGPILEFGCGNGRVTRALAQAGLCVWGVDLSKPMLDDFEQWLQQAPPALRDRITLVHGDMRSVELDERFPLVLAPFNVLLHLYTRGDVERFLANVRHHLAPAGTFVCDVSVPSPSDLSRSPHRTYKAPSFVHPRTRQRIGYSERFEYDPMRQLLVVWMQFVPEDGSTPWTVPLTHRQFFPCELEGYFQQAGFSSYTLSSDFSDDPPSAHTDSLIVACRA